MEFVLLYRLSVTPSFILLKQQKIILSTFSLNVFTFYYGGENVKKEIKTSYTNKRIFINTVIHYLNNNEKMYFIFVFN